MTKLKILVRLLFTKHWIVVTDTKMAYEMPVDKLSVAVHALDMAMLQDMHRHMDEYYGQCALDEVKQLLQHG